jgi:hypothetical protein
LTTTIDFCNGFAGLTGEEYFVMVRETWEMWADEYQDYWEAKGNYAEEFQQDDIDAWKEEEQKVIDELIQRMQGAYNDV